MGIFSPSSSPSSPSSSSSSSSSTSPSSNPVIPNSGRVSVNIITHTFTSLENDTIAQGGKIPVSGFVEACLSSISVCGHLFGNGSMVARLLGRTTKRQSGCITKIHGLDSTPASAKESLQSLCMWERDIQGVEGVRRNRLSACHTTLWLNRGLCFLQTIMELTVSDSDISRSPRACAAAAYQLTLRPYHSAIVGGIFRAAISFAPQERTAMFQTFGWNDEAEAVSEVTACSQAMKPITRRVNDFLRTEGLDFPDKIGTVLK